MPTRYVAPFVGLDFGVREWVGDLPHVPGAELLLREWIGDRHVKSLEAFGYTIKNKPFEATVGISRDDYEDDKYGLYATTFAQMGNNAASHPDTLVFPLLAAGNTNLCYDGQYFFDTDHPVGTGTVSNWGGGSGSGWYLLVTPKPIKPLVRGAPNDKRHCLDFRDSAAVARCVGE